MREVARARLVSMRGIGVMAPTVSSLSQLLRLLHALDKIDSLESNASTGTIVTWAG